MKVAIDAVLQWVGSNETEDNVTPPSPLPLELRRDHPAHHQWYRQRALAELRGPDFSGWVW